MTLKVRFMTMRMSSAMVKILRLPSILVVVGRKKSCGQDVEVGRGVKQMMRARSAAALCSWLWLQAWAGLPPRCTSRAQIRDLPQIKPRSDEAKAQPTCIENLR